jgi:hypothetical protein
MLRVVWVIHADAVDPTSNRMGADMRERIPVVLAVLGAMALTGGHPVTARAQDKAQITDVFKEHLAVGDPKVVSVRRYDVPPGWATPMHQHTGTCFSTSWKVRERWRPRAKCEPSEPVR